MNSMHLAGALMLISGMSEGAVALSGTRLIFEGRYDEATLDVINRGDSETLIQTWLDTPTADDGNGHIKAAELPFAVTPHLARMPAQGRQTLRLLYEGVGVPRDRESLLHLFVLEIPRRSPAAQQMSIAIRQRINVFYRPVGLSGDPADAPQNLTWQRLPSAGSVLSVRNPTPYHVSLQALRINGIDVAEYRLLAPFSNAALSLPATYVEHVGPQTLTFKALTDYGGQREYCASFQGAESFVVPLKQPGSSSIIGKC
ncbi:molecular chaperone [Pseudomonas lutea]|uniref:Molecular chaperone n=1 Tax=Pseudomonas lutea TaxID=243924 RepID=A0A9X0JL50_9PSED|nr:molecular chaperone [Pseudomonas lutea]KGF66584.1 hypothetical protein LT42_12075 [Pseudomonas lutea]